MNETQKLQLKLLSQLLFAVENWSVEAQGSLLGYCQCSIFLTYFILQRVFSFSVTDDIEEAFQDFCMCVVFSNDTEYM